MTRAAGVVAPPRGWPGGGRGWAAHVESAAEYQATTVQACGLFPFTAGSGSPTAGVPFGRHMMWGEVVCCDPFAWMEAVPTTSGPPSAAPTPMVVAGVGTAERDCDEGDDALGEGRAYRGEDGPDSEGARTTRRPGR